MRGDMINFTKLSTLALTALLFSFSMAYAGDSPADIKARIGKGDPVAGKDKSAMCQGCHGEDGNSAAPTFPKLAGQYAKYLQKQVHDFQSEARRSDHERDGTNGYRTSGLARYNGILC